MSSTTTRQRPRNRATAGFYAGIVLAGIVVAGIALLMGTIALSGPDGAQLPATDGGERAEGAAGPTRDLDLFAPHSFWNEPLADDAQLDPASEQMVGDLVAEVAREQELTIGPWIATNASTPLYTVPRDQELVHVTLDNSSPELQAAFERVPIPADAVPADGSDAHMTIWQPSTDRLWEFWQAREEPDGWYARWGGAMRNVSESPGYFTADSWPGATHRWGATATSLPVIGGVMLIEELQSAEIDHALAVNLPFPRAGEYSWPAQRTDGTGPPDAIPEGARLRLDPDLDLDSLNLHPVIRTMAEAAQRYGMVVRDRTGSVIAFAAEDPTGANPYRNASGGLFRDQFPTDFTDEFPWEHLQVLELSLCHDPYRPCPAP